MRYLLNILYLSLLTLAFPYLVYRRLKTGRYREGFREKFLGQIPRRDSQAQCVWFHAVSVGEVLQIEPVVNAWKERHPDWEVAISITTQTGMQVARKTYSDCRLFYCPLDFSWAIRNTIRRLSPSCLALVELELWPNLILETHRASIPVTLINGRLSANSYKGYRRFRVLIRPLLQRFSLIVAQNSEYADRFLALGASASRLGIAGSIKFDRLMTDPKHSRVQELCKAFAILPNAPVLMAGSTGEPEESLILSAWKTLRNEFPDLQLIIAPRHQERFDEVSQLIQDAGSPVLRRSLINSGVPSGIDVDSSTVRLLDTLGELSACWGLADIAFVGGSFNQRGGQNMMEPAGYGAAVVLGPNTWNFVEVVEELERRKACMVIPTGEELADCISVLLHQPGNAELIGNAARKYVISQQGATQKTMEWIEHTLEIPLERNQKTAA